MPPRATAAPAASSQGASAPSAAGPAAPRVTMPSGIAWTVMKRYQNLFILVAHSEVRSRGDGGTLSTKEQERVMLESYKNHVRLWYRDDATLLDTPNFPPCPANLKRVGSEEDVVACMLSTTQTGNNSFNGPSLLRRAKECKTDFLKLIADWNMLCGNSAQSATIGQPGTGVTKEAMYQRLVACHFRKEETARVLKLRQSCAGVEFPQQAHCTTEKIREARFSYYYATRGYSKAQEESDKSSFESSRLARRWAIRGQMDALVRADEDHEAANPAAAENRVPPSADSRQSFVEQDQPAHFDIELGVAFQVFGPYEGNLRMTAFWTAAWSQHRMAAGQLAGRAVAQHRQRHQRQIESDGELRPFPGAAQLPPAQLPLAGGSVSSVQGLSRHAAKEQQRQDMNHNLANLQHAAAAANILERHRLEENQRQQRIENLSLALTHHAHLPAVSVSNMRLELVRLLEMPPLPLPEIPEVRPRDTDDFTCSAANRRRTSAPAPAPATTAPVASTNGNASADVADNDTYLLAEMERLHEHFVELDCGANGDCLFHVLRYLERCDVPHARLAAAGIDNDTDSVVQTRSRIVDHLAASLSLVNDVITSTIVLYGVSVVPELQPSVDEYIVAMRDEGTCGGLVELAVWANMLSVRVHVHSTTMWGSRMHVEVVGPPILEGESTPQYHVLHISGLGGGTGHYRLLQPLAGSGNNANDAVAV